MPQWVLPDRKDLQALVAVVLLEHKVLPELMELRVLRVRLARQVAKVGLVLQELLELKELAELPGFKVIREQLARQVYKVLPEQLALLVSLVLQVSLDNRALQDLPEAQVPLVYKVLAA